MRERKIYPNLSDEELDRRAEEALKRMLANPQKPQGQGQGAPGGGHGSNSRRRQKRRPK